MQMESLKKKRMEFRRWLFVKDHGPNDKMVETNWSNDI